MDNQNDKLLEIIEKQQEQIDLLKQQTQDIARMSAEAQKKSIKNDRGRRQNRLLGLVLLIFIFASGTYAAYITIGRTAIGVNVHDTNHYGRLHDNFAILGGGERNKDIFAENFGEDGIFVRIQLREFMQDANGNIIGQAESTNLIDMQNPLTWPLFQADPTNIHQRRSGTATATIGQAGVSWTLGDTNPTRKIFMPTHNRVTREVEDGEWTSEVPELFRNINTFLMTEATGRAVDAVAGIDDFSIFNAVADIASFGNQTGPGLALTSGLGTQDEWRAGDELTAPLLYVNLNGQIAVYDEAYTMIARPTLTPTHGSIMTLQNWEANGEPRGNFWVYDQNDSWFYWAGRLPGGAATSLLLDSFQIVGLQEGFGYAISIQAEFFTEAEANSDDFIISPVARRMLLSEYQIVTTPSGRQVLTQGETLWIDPARLYDIIFGNVPVHIPQPTTNFVIELLDLVGNPVGEWDNPATIATPGIRASITNEYGTRLRTIQDTDAAATRNTQHFALTVGNNQPAGDFQLRIRETTRNVSTYIPITVIELEHELPSTDNLTWITGEPWAAHSIFQDPNNPYLQWRVLVPDDGAGNALIITQHIQGKGSHVAWNLPSRWVPFEFSNAFTEMEHWWENPIPTTGPGNFIRSLSLNYGYQTALRATVEAIASGHSGVEQGIVPQSPTSLNENRAITRPRRTPGHGLNQGVPTAFVLSVSEANRYFSSDAQRVATRIPNLPAFANNDNRWHLRSQGNANAVVACVGWGGNVWSTTGTGAHTCGGNTTAGANRALRPAVWIRLNH